VVWSTLLAQTSSLSSPDFGAISTLFGQDEMHPLYDLFPEGALSVTAAFLRTIHVNRLGKYLSRQLSDLSPAEWTAKNAWEDAFADILSSITVSRCR
jgi:hypothetical protein